MDKHVKLAYFLLAMPFLIVALIVGFIFIRPIFRLEAKHNCENIGNYAAPWMTEAMKEWCKDEKTN